MCRIATRMKRSMWKYSGITIGILQAHVEGVYIGDILPRPQCISLGCVTSDPTGVQGRRDPACESRGSFGRMEKIQGTQNMS